MRYALAVLWAIPFELAGLLLCLTYVGFPLGLVLMKIGATPMEHLLDKRTQRKLAKHLRRVDSVTPIETTLTPVTPKPILPSPQIGVLERFRREDVGRYYNLIDSGKEEWDARPKPWEEDTDA